MKYKFTYGGMLFGKEERKALITSADKNWWSLSQEGVEMEKEMAAYVGVKYGVLANSGTSAGLLALKALELPVGSEVIIPATTFPTIFNIILWCGLTPVVVDSKVGTYNLDPDELEAAISPKTKAIICVHAVGNPVDMPKVMKIAKKHKLYVLEDNCDGLGSTINGKKVGSFGHVSFTSFHAGHIVSMGQGGGVFTNDKKIARNAKMYRSWGRQLDIVSRVNTKWKNLPKDYDSRFIYEKAGLNLEPLEQQAAMGRVQLRKIEKIKAARKRNFNYLYKELLKFDDLFMPEWLPNADVCWFSFPLSCYGDRGKLIAYLEDNGIETRSMFAGDITRHPAYENTNFRVSGELFEANYILHKSFWITVHPRYKAKDLKYIIKVFEDYYAEPSSSYTDTSNGNRISNRAKRSGHTVKH